MSSSLSIGLRRLCCKLRSSSCHNSTRGLTTPSRYGESYQASHYATAAPKPQIFTLQQIRALSNSCTTSPSFYSPNPTFVRGWRFYSQAEEEESEFDAEDFPQAPEKKVEDVIKAFPRLGSGKIVSKKERRAGRVPSIVFEQENGHLGGNKVLISVETKQIERLLKKLGKSFFLSRTFDLEIYSDEGELESRERVLPRSIHLHAGTDKIMNVTFIRAPPTACLKVHVPLVFLGEDACPGIRKGGYVYTMERTVKYLCPADAIPPFIEVDLSMLDIGQKILLKDLKVGSNLQLLQNDGSFPVCKIKGSRGAAAAAAAAAAS